MNPRIAHLIDSLDLSGGAEEQLIANLRTFDHSRIHHELILLQELEESRVHQVPPEVPVFVLFAGDERITRLAAFRRLRKLTHRRNYDIVHATLSNAALAARLLGLFGQTTVVESLVNISHETIRTVDNPAVTTTKLRYHTYVDRLSIRGVDRFHAISEVVARSWSTIAKVDPGRIDVIPRGVDPKRILGGVSASTRKEVCEELGIDSDRSLIVLAVGRQEPQKGHRYLIEATHKLRDQLPDLRVVIVGRRGNSSPLLEKLVDEFDLREVVLFPGPRNDISRFLAASDIFAFPSLFEGRGNALGEAMVAGLPIITTDAEPMTDLIPDDRYGLLVPPCDSGALAEAIARLAGDSERKVLLGEAAKSRSRSFPTLGEVARRYEGWYEKLLADQR